MPFRSATCSRGHGTARLAAMAEPRRQLLVRGLFRVWSHVYNRPVFQWTLYSRVHRRLFRQAGGIAPESILDVGCGTGELLVAARERWQSARLTGVDLSPAMLARARAKDFGRPVELVEASVYDLPFEPGSFDSGLQHDLVPLLPGRRARVRRDVARARTRRHLAPGEPDDRAARARTRDGLEIHQRARRRVPRAGGAGEAAPRGRSRGRRQPLHPARRLAVPQREALAGVALGRVLCSPRCARSPSAGSCSPCSSAGCGPREKAAHPDGAGPVRYAPARGGSPASPTRQCSSHPNRTLPSTSRSTRSDSVASCRATCRSCSPRRETRTWARRARRATWCVAAGSISACAAGL